MHAPPAFPLPVVLHAGFGAFEPAARPPLKISSRCAPSLTYTQRPDRAVTTGGLPDCDVRQLAPPPGRNLPFPPRVAPGGPPCCAAYLVSLMWLPVACSGIHHDTLGESALGTLLSITSAHLYQRSSCWLGFTALAGAPGTPLYFKCFDYRAPQGARRRRAAAPLQLSHKTISALAVPCLRWLALCGQPKGSVLGCLRVASAADVVSDGGCRRWHVLSPAACCRSFCVAWEFCSMQSLHCLTICRNCYKTHNVVAFAGLFCMLPLLLLVRWASALFQLSLTLSRYGHLWQQGWLFLFRLR